MADYSSDLANEDKLSLENVIATLQYENDSLKSQLNQALILPKELEQLHIKNRELTSQLLTSNSKIENLQNRLKLSQQKSADAENKQYQAENKLHACQQDLLNSNEEKKLLEDKLEKINQDLKNEVESRNSDFQECNKFFRTVSALCGSSVSTYDQVLDTLTMLNETSKKQNEQILKSKEYETKVQKLTKNNKRVKEEYKQVCIENERINGELDDLKKKMDDITKETKTHVNKSETQQKEFQVLIQQMRDERKKDSDSFGLEREKYEQRISDLQSEIDRLNEIINAKEKRIKDLKNRIDSPEHNGIDERNRLIEELSNKSHENEIMTTHLSEMTSNLATLEAKLKSSVNHIQKVRLSNEHLKQKNATLANRVSELETLSSQLQLGHDNISASLHNANIEVDSLKMQLQAAKASHSQDAAAFASQVHETEKARKAVDLIEPVADQLRKEIEILSDSKRKLLNLVRRQASLIAMFDSSSRELSAQLEESKRRLKYSNSKENSQLDACSQFSVLVAQHLIPEFNDPLRTRLSSVLTGTVGSQMQKCVAVFREIACSYAASQKPLKQKEEELCRINKEKESQLQSLNSQHSVIRAAIEGFAYLFRTKRADDHILGCDSMRDHDLIDFATRQTQNLERILQQNDVLDHFSSMNFLLGGSYEDRRAALQDIVAKGWDANSTFDLFCIQLLINTVQERELNILRNNVVSRQQEMEMLQDALGCSDLARATDDIKQLQEDLCKTKKRNKKLTTLLQELRSRENFISENHAIIQDYQNISKKLTEYEKTISNLNQEISSLNYTIEDRDKKLMRAQDQSEKTLAIAKEEAASLRNELNEAERSLDERNSQIRTLTIQNQQARTDHEIQIRGYKKQIEDLQLAAAQKQEKWQQQFAALREYSKEQKKQFLAKIKEQQKEVSDERTQYVNIQSDLQKKLKQTIDAMSFQLGEKDQLNKRLSEDLRLSEDRNKAMAADISKLTIAKKGLEVQLQSVKDQLEREIQLIQSQQTFREISSETKHQEEMCSLKAKCNGEKNQMLLRILEEFDVLKTFGEEDIDENSAMEMIVKVASDYKSQRHMY